MGKYWHTLINRATEKQEDLMLRPKVIDRTAKITSDKSGFIEPFKEEETSLSLLPEADSSVSVLPKKTLKENLPEKPAAKTPEQNIIYPPEKKDEGRYTDIRPVTRPKKEPAPIKKSKPGMIDKKNKITIKEETVKGPKRNSGTKNKYLPIPQQKKGSIKIKESVSGLSDIPVLKPGLHKKKEVTSHDRLLPATPKKQDSKPRSDTKEEKNSVRIKKEVVRILKRTLPERPQNLKLKTGPEVHIGTIKVEVIQPPQQDTKPKDMPQIIYRYKSQPKMITPKRGRHLGIGQV